MNVSGITSAIRSTHLGAGLGAMSPELSMAAVSGRAAALQRLIGDTHAGTAATQVASPPPSTAKPTGHDAWLQRIAVHFD